ncbi:hypothetical protein EDD55_10598 [Varunaivibrio sulfuroxidans]|uniref:Uncharacterized protein n=1 Tax=Varunaivibrio sulfuroxidans TaxID=1773489 RepID=A0A4R3JAB2_9PROT|nr:hypothetical protein EDD55_10598 [Varunaivibrio sulfuroxidans]
MSGVVMEFEDRLRRVVNHACGHNDNLKGKSLFENSDEHLAKGRSYKVTVYVPVTVTIYNIYKKMSCEAIHGVSSGQSAHDEPAHVARRRALLASLPPYKY